MGRMSLTLVLSVILVGGITFVSINNINNESNQQSADYATKSEANTIANSAIERAIHQYMANENSDATDPIERYVKNKKVNVKFKNLNTATDIDTINIVGTTTKDEEMIDQSVVHMVVDRRQYSIETAISSNKDSVKYEGPGGKIECPDGAPGIAVPDTTSDNVDVGSKLLENIITDGEAITEKEYNNIPPHELVDKYMDDKNAEDIGNGSAEIENKVLGGGNQLVYASTESTGKDKVELTEDLSGSGILVIDGDFETKSTAKLDWEGLVLVANDDTSQGTHVELQGDEINGGLIVGGSENHQDHVELKKSGGSSSGGDDLLSEAIEKTQDFIDDVEDKQKENMVEGEDYNMYKPSDLIGYRGEFKQDYDDATGQLQAEVNSEGEKLTGKGLKGFKSYLETARDGFASGDLDLNEISQNTEIEEENIANNLLVDGLASPFAGEELSTFASKEKPDMGSWFNPDWKIFILKTIGGMTQRTIRKMKKQ